MVKFQENFEGCSLHMAFPPIDINGCVDKQITTTRPNNLVKHVTRAEPSKRSVNSISVQTINESAFFKNNIVLQIYVPQILHCG